MSVTFKRSSQFCSVLFLAYRVPPPPRLYDLLNSPQLQVKWKQFSTEKKPEVTILFSFFFFPSYKYHPVVIKLLLLRNSSHASSVILKCSLRQLLCHCQKEANGYRTLNRIENAPEWSSERWMCRDLFGGLFVCRQGRYAILFSATFLSHCTN